MLRLLLCVMVVVSLSSWLRCYRLSFNAKYRSVVEP